MTLNQPMTNGVLYWDDYGIRTTKIPIDLSSGSQVKIRIITVPVLAGDLLKISGEVNLTNDANRPPGYTVGIATQLWLYDASTPPEEDRQATYRLIGQRGDNITPLGHHAGLGVGPRPYVIPAGWVPGRSAGITLSCDAHSTGEPAGNNDHITVETQGCLIVERCRVS